MKRLIAVLLAVFMVASLCTVFSLAEDENLASKLDGGATGFDNYTADLTDGKTTDKVTYDNNWFAFYYNTDAAGNPNANVNAPDKIGTLVYDLAENCTINKVRVHGALGVRTDGIQAPKSITVSTSVDGQTYTQFAKKDIEASDDKEAIDWTELEGAATVGRYVKVEIEMRGVFAFLDEVEILGTKGGDPSNNPEPEVSETTSSEDTDSEATSSDDTSSEAATSEATSSEVESKTESTDSTAESSNTSTGDEEPANLTWLWIVIAVVVVAAVVVLAVTAKKKK